MWAWHLNLFSMTKIKYFQATTEGPCLELPEILQQYKILRSTIVDFKDDPHVHQVLSSFRDFCTILWLLHVRDELSLHLRKRGKQLHNEKTDGQVTWFAFHIPVCNVLERDMGTDNPLYTDTRYNNKIYYNDKLTVTKQLLNRH